MADFAAAIEKLGRDESLRVVVLRGEGERAFIGGADIGDMAALDQGTAREFITALHLCCEAIRNLPVPVIARCAGYTLGAGLEIAAACDLRVAADSAQFGMPEVRLGIPSVIEAALLPSLIGWGRTRRLLLLGETIGAAQAEAWGLVERVVAAADLDRAIEDWVQTILGMGREALRLQKMLIRKWEDLPMRAAIAAGIDSFESAYSTDEPRRKMSEFLRR